MLFTKNYYTVLGLSGPTSTTTTTFANTTATSSRPLDQKTLRKAYKNALLAAHPDKATAVDAAAAAGPKYTVDDVKEALAVLSDDKRRAEFERWLLTASTSTSTATTKLGEGRGDDDADFVLGLELLDLSDFEAGMPPWVRIETPPGEEEEVEIDFEDLERLERLRLEREREEKEEEQNKDTQGNDTAQEATGSDRIPKDQDQPHISPSPSPSPSPTNDIPGGEMEWTRACRCGAEKGFVIREAELEEAESRGEKEVLVGCEGCSLWVRVGFDVEEG